MSVRPATHADLPALLELAGQMHREAPSYRGWQYDAGKVDATLRLMIDGAGCVLVSEIDGAVRGAVVGMATEHWFSTDIVATDLALFIGREHRNGTTALRLIAGFIKWAELIGAKRVQMGVTTGVHPASTGKLYRGAGLAETGAVYSRDF